MFKTIKKGITSNAVALVLSIFIVISCMYIYCPEYIFPVSLLIIIIQASVFTFYDFLYGKSMLLKFVSVLGSFFCILGMVAIAVKTGQNKSSYDYFIWFLSPQALVSFSFSYIAATFILINFFISSTIYYFSAVRYRLSMTFLITMIPFAFYRKEGNAVPALIAFVLLAMYIIMMIHYRNVNTKSDQKMILDLGYKKSIFYFIALTSAVTFIIPRPQNNFAASAWFSSVIESEKLSEYMLKRLGVTTTTSSSYSVYTSSQNIHLYTFITDDLPLNIKFQTFSSYDSSRNSWNAVSGDLIGEPLEKSYAKYLDPAGFYEAVAYADHNNSEFSEKYSLGLKKSSLPEKSEKLLSMTYCIQPSRYYVSPTLSYKIKNDIDDVVYRSENGLLYRNLKNEMTYSLEFYSGKLDKYGDFKTILKSLNMSAYGEFLNDLKVSLADSEKYTDVVDAYINDFEYSEKYLAGSNGYIPNRIKNLSDEITNGIDSDYEKAVAIQNYFTKNGFVYDINYQKPVDYDIETFLFKDKRGVCSDYATSMVLLARSAGIPARYAEGLHLEKSANSREAANNIVSVSDADLHAFPELFIAGYGWMTFEPTQAPEESKSFLSRFLLNIIIAAGTVVVIILAVLFRVFVYPDLAERLFERKIGKRSNEEAVILIGKRVRNFAGCTESSSSENAVRAVREIYSCDVSEIFKAYDSAVYGNNKISNEKYDSVYKNYIEMYGVIKEYKKRRNRKWKLKKS